MNDILFGNNNRAIIKKITKRELAADKKRNFFIVAAILLTAFMLTSVFSIGMSYYNSIAMREKRMQGSISQAAFSKPTVEQLSKIDTLDYVDTVGIGATVAATDDVPGMSLLSISYVDQTQWEKMFCPTYTNIVGHYPESENEIMLSRYILDALGVDNPEVGMTIPLSFTANGQTDAADFVLSCIYTEYSHSRPGSDISIYCSKAFAEKQNALTPGRLTVNLIFTDNHVNENMERLMAELPFYENQPYIQSPAFSDNDGNATTYIALSVLVLFLMFAGYLLIYNVMYISVSRDVQFLGMLKTMGTTPKQIKQIIIGQVLRLCMVGLPLGCLAGAAVSLLIVPKIISNSGIETGAVVSFSPIIYIGAIAFSLLTAWIGAIAPAKKAANISPIEALHYSGEYIAKTEVRHPTKGKPIRMALRNIFRDRKRAIIVMLSLFLSLSVFTSVMTVVNSIDIDNYINAEYDYDFGFTADMSNSYFLSDEYMEQVQELEGIKDTSAIRIGSVELLYSDHLAAYADWLAQDIGMSVDTIVAGGTFFQTHTLKGIDLILLEEINQSLPVPVDKERFERGEIAIINTSNPELLSRLNDITALEIKKDTDGEYHSFSIGGVVCLPAQQDETAFSYSVLEILVSNSVLQQYVKSPQLVSFGMNVESDYEEQLYHTLKDFSADHNISMTSRYEGRQSMQDAKTMMLVLGGGISFILGFIGAFNFINVMSVGVMARSHEFSTLESIGMSKKQLRSMLRYEGAGYASLTLFFAVTLGNLIGYGIFRLFKSIVEYASFSYPIIPVATVYFVVLLVCLITPEVAYRSISKNTLAHRLRQI